MLNNKRWISEWNEMGNWARGNTDLGSIFLIPVGGPEDPPGLDEIGLMEWRAAHGASIFEFAARRRVWVNWHRGAAAMWYPPYYKVWHQRVNEVQATQSFDDRLNYARKSGIGYVIEVCTQAGNAPPLFRTNRLCLFQASAPV
jgi:hypothetical protein